MIKGNKIKEIALDGVVRQNPSLRLVLGTCPALGVTTTATNGLGMGLAVVFVLVLSNVTISLLRNIIPDRVRIPCLIVVIATLSTILRMAMDAFFPDLYESMGIFISLVAVNCLILGRAESFASGNKVGHSALDGLFMGVGFTLALTVLGIVREVLGSATLFGLVLPWDFKIEVFAKPAGAYLTYGVLIAVFSYVSGVVERKIQHKQHSLVKEATV